MGLNWKTRIDLDGLTQSFPFFPIIWCMQVEFSGVSSVFFLFFPNFCIVLRQLLLCTVDLVRGAFSCAFAWKRVCYSVLGAHDLLISIIHFCPYTFESILERPINNIDLKRVEKCRILHLELVKWSSGGKKWEIISSREHSYKIQESSAGKHLGDYLLCFLLSGKISSKSFQLLQLPSNFCKTPAKVNPPYLIPLYWHSHFGESLLF